MGKASGIIMLASYIKYYEQLYMVNGPYFVEVNNVQRIVIRCELFVW